MPAYPPYELQFVKAPAPKVTPATVLVEGKPFMVEGPHPLVVSLTSANVQIVVSHVEEPTPVSPRLKLVITELPK